MAMSFLVATDLSARSDRAIARAFRLAKTLGAEVIALCVIDDALPADIVARMQKDMAAKLSQFADSLPQASEITHRQAVVTGDPVATIATEAMKHDMLVVGTHRLRAFLDLFKETTMERIVRLIERPVLLVCDPVDHDYRTVLSAVDFAPASAAALRFGAQIAPAAALHALHAVHVPYRGFIAPGNSAMSGAPFVHEAEDRMRRWRDIEDLPGQLGEVEIVEGPAHGLLLRRVETLKPDLLTVGAHGRADAAPALLGSLSNDLIRTPPCDLLVAR